MAELCLTQRDIEGALEDLSAIYERIEDCDEVDELRGYTETLHRVATRLQVVARGWAALADEAEAEEEDETCVYCDSTLDECTCHEDEKYCERCNCRMPLDCSEHDNTGICEDCVG